MDKDLLIIGHASETLDTMYPYYRLQEAGFRPVVAGQERHEFQMVMHEVRPGWTITKEWEGYRITAEITFRDIDPSEYVGIFFNGGALRSIFATIPT
jgi:protease I